MNDEKDNNAAIYSEITAVLGLPDGASREHIRATIVTLAERAEMVIDSDINIALDIRFAVLQMLSGSGVGAGVDMSLGFLKTAIDDLLPRRPSREELRDEVRWLDKRGLVILTEGLVIENVMITDLGLDVAKGLMHIMEEEGKKEEGE